MKSIEILKGKKREEGDDDVTVPTSDTSIKQKHKKRLLTRATRLPVMMGRTPSLTKCLTLSSCSLLMLFVDGIVVGVVSVVEGDDSVVEVVGSSRSVELDNEHTEVKESLLYGSMV